MAKKFISTSTKYSIGSIIVMLTMVIISSITTGFFFARNCLTNYYENASTELLEFSDTITMFFDSKEVELNVFATSDEVKAADDTIHSFVDEIGDISILGYKKSPVEADIRKICKNFASHDPDIAEIYLGTKWGGYATNFDSTMSGGYDPRKRGWYATANSGNGKVMITDAFASTVGATVVGITRCAYDNNANFIGNASIEVSLDTLTKILGKVTLGDDSFMILFQKDGTILADTAAPENNFKKVDDLNIPGLKKLLSEKTSNVSHGILHIGKKSTALTSPAAIAANSHSGSVKINGNTYFAQFITNPKTGYQIAAFCPKQTVFSEFYSTLSITIIVCILLTIIIAIIVSAITRKMMNPLKKIIYSLERIENNDFTHEIDVTTRDELGNVSETFNETIKTLRNSFGMISQNTNELDKIGNSLAGDMNNISNEISKITENIVSISKQSDSLNESVHLTNNSEREISEAISKLNTSTESQSSCVENSKESATKMINNISDISNSIDNTNTAVKSLLQATATGRDNMKVSSEIAQRISEASGSLQEASNVILNVASQTNLLAMNAAIEASHAGSAGQGFAVVANEIRSLAEQSSKQGKVISQTLNDVSQEITNLADSIKSVESSLTEIFTLSENVSSLTNNVQHVMGEHEESCRDVLSAIDEIENVTTSVRKETDGIFKASKSVANAMGTMSGIASSLSDQMSQMETGAKIISESSEAVNELTQMNKGKISLLADEVNKFKIQ